MESRGVSILGLLVGVAGVVFLSGGALAAQCGKAAWYDLDGQTASGERASGETMTAAHRTLPFGTRVRVDNLANGKSVIVRVNDRGPFVAGRVIDVTRAAAEQLGMIRSGIAKVRVSLVDGGARLDESCADPAPRTITAESVADDPPKVVAAARHAAPDPDPRTKDEIAAATPSPNESKPVRSSGKTLVASVQYDEGDGAPVPPRSASGADTAASFSDEPQLDDLEDGRIVAAVAETVDIPLPRPRPPVFGDSPGGGSDDAARPVFNRTLALRFLDAFAPPEPGMQLDVRALGYAPMPEPRGAVITE